MLKKGRFFMKTVNEVSKLAGVSVRTLHHYDKIGLLKPTALTDAGYRLYDDFALERLQQILLFKELEFPLNEIKNILSSPDFNSNTALEHQIALLTLKKERLENLIEFARWIKLKGVFEMDFSAFDTSKISEYSAKAKEYYSHTKEYKEFEAKGLTDGQEKAYGAELMSILAQFGRMIKLSPDSSAVQEKVSELQAFISEHFYNCSDEMLLNLGAMYAGGGEFTKNIDNAGGEGTAEFVYKAIKEKVK